MSQGMLLRIIIIMGKHLIKLGKRKCLMCGEIKPLEDFYNSKSRPGGKEQRCKKCSHKRNIEYIKKIAAFYKQYHKKSTKIT